MNEITFEDILTHYQGKLQEAAEELQNIRKQVKDVAVVVDSSWNGKAAQACRNKLDEINQELSKAGSELSEALTKLLVISDAYADELSNIV